jgi:hypothetical protein
MRLTTVAPVFCSVAGFGLPASVCTRLRDTCRGVVAGGAPVPVVLCEATLLGDRLGRSLGEDLVGFVQQILEIFLQRLPEAVLDLFSIWMREVLPLPATPPLPVASELVEICVLVDTVPSPRGRY